jgi:modification methylase
MSEPLPVYEAYETESARPYHKVANLFPLIQGDEYERLKADIAANGLLEAIWLHPDSSIIDGRNRHRACLDLGIEPRFRTWNGQGSLVAFVVSLNLERRHLTSSQRAVIALDALPLFEEEARERHEKLAGRPSKNGGNNSTGYDDAETGKARDHAAKTTQTNGRYVSDAKTLQKEAPDLLEDVRKGELSIPYAMRKLGHRNAEWRIEKRNQPTTPAATKPRLIVGDATNLHQLADESIDLVITSPPYNLGDESWPMGGYGRVPRTNGIGYRDDLAQEPYEEWQLCVLQELFRVARPGASLFYNHKTRTQDGVLQHPMTWLCRVQGWTLRQEIVWDREVTHNHSKTLFWPVDERIYWFTKGKPAISENGIGMPSVWRFHGPEPYTWHPAPFPEELPRRCLQAVGRPGITVLDPFAGSCTTLHVALDMGYEAIGVDIEKGYLDQARDLYGW